MENKVVNFLKQGGLRAAAFRWANKGNTFGYYLPKLSINPFLTISSFFISILRILIFIIRFLTSPYVLVPIIVGITIYILIKKN